MNSSKPKKNNRPADEVLPGARALVTVEVDRDQALSIFINLKEKLSLLLKERQDMTARIEGMRQDLIRIRKVLPAFSEDSSVSDEAK